MNKRLAGIVVGALVKSAFVFASVAVPLKVGGLPAGPAGVLLFTFSWPQVVTALAGGIIYAAVKRVLGRRGGGGRTIQG